MTIESRTRTRRPRVAFFNTSGRIANSRIGTIKPEGGPYTYGLVMTNSLQGAEAGIRREVTLEKSLVNGVVLFDDARGADGTATTTARSGIKAYGNIVGSRIAGSVGYTYGQRGTISGSEITGQVVLTDAETGPDPSNPLVRAFSATGSSLLGGLTNSGSGAGAFVGGNLGHRHHDRPGRARDARWTEAPAPLSRARRAPPTPSRLKRSSTRTGRPRWPGTRPSTRSWSPRTISASSPSRSAANGLPVAPPRARSPYEFEYRPGVRGHRRACRADRDDHRLLRPDEHRLDRVSMCPW